MILHVIIEKTCFLRYQGLRFCTQKLILIFLFLKHEKCLGQDSNPLPPTDPYRHCNYTRAAALPTELPRHWLKSRSSSIVAMPVWVCRWSQVRIPPETFLMFQKQLYSVFYIEICGTTGPLSKEQASCQQNYFRDWPQVLWISLVIRGRNTYTG